MCNFNGVFGIYFHIPFCLQRCHYCDFATYSEDQVKVNSGYVDSLILEIEKQRYLFKERKVDTIYFGGGTPSLLEGHEFHRIFNGLRDNGFTFDEKTEVTIEINPATVSVDKLLSIKEAGINRMSVGAQTFADHHLKACGRKHSSLDTRETVELLKKHKTNFSLDLLFSLPNQTLEELNRDLDEFIDIFPNHISPYCLTLNDKHPMNRNRPKEGIQLKMFEVIDERLQKAGYLQYEISNFSRPGFESKHNGLYWNDSSYWGLGLSAHSYRNYPDWGSRFWNPSDYNTYLKTIAARPHGSSRIQDYFQASNFETLEKHQSLTDFCHTALRALTGLNKNSLRHKYGSQAHQLMSTRMESMIEEELVESSPSSWSLTPKGILLSNIVFSHVFVSKGEIDNVPGDPIISSHP